MQSYHIHASRIDPDWRETSLKYRVTDRWVIFSCHNECASISHHIQLSNIINLASQKLVSVTQGEYKKWRRLDSWSLLLPKINSNGAEGR